jgi:hypothetical protein
MVCFTLACGANAQTTSRPGVPATASTAPAATATASAPGTAADAKSYVHPGTKMAFPEKVAGFTRVEVTKFAADESDVGVGYNADDPTLPIVVTVFVFPAPAVTKLAAETAEQAAARQFQRALEAVKTEIAGSHEDAKVLSEGEFVLRQGEQSHKGVKVTYDMNYRSGNQAVPTRSDMFLFLRGAWQIEYRVSYPKAAAGAAQAVIEKLMGALKWGG